MSSSNKVDLEDDFDDLDDVLGRFSTQPVLKESNSTNAASSSTKRKEAVPPPEEGMSEEEFAKQFAAEMESFLKGIAPGSDANEGGDEEERSIDPDAAQKAEALRKAWEQLLVEDLEGEDRDEPMEKVATASTSSAIPAKGKDAATSSKKATEEVEDEFQKAVRQAMEKLKQSDDTNKADSSDADLASLLSSFGGMNFGADGGNPEDVQGVLESLMGQLMSKEILYEPLKELYEKFPDYMEKNREMLPMKDAERYDKQYEIVTQVITIFEKPGYSDDDPKATAQLIRLMSEMQECGSPPSEIMGALPPGFDAGPDGLPNLGEGCIIA